MYMKEIKLVTAEGFESKDEMEWTTLCNKYKIVNNIGHLDHFILSDITLLDKNEVIQYTGEYAEIEPIYIDLNTNRPENMYIPVHPQQSQSPAPNNNPVRSQGENKPQKPPKPNAEMDFTRPVVPPNPRTLIRSSDIQTCEAKHIASMSEVPKDLQHLSVGEVCDCLNLLNMGKYIETFHSQQVDGQLLFDLDRDMMKNTFGMNNFHIIKMMRFRGGWRPM
ncbi:uncharacterized protein [Heptranchias perlo]|uniref:uncharacterized protein n=1 Tax=Heptranchias perlo TaxID=212740 RepID=UPI00355A57A8